jgi:hypothetical protein
MCVISRIEESKFWHALDDLMVLVLNRILGIEPEPLYFGIVEVQ